MVSSSVDLVAEQLISSRYFGPLCEAVSRSGANTDALVAATGISVAQMQSHDEMLPFDSLLSAWQSSMTLCNDHMLPMHLGANPHPSLFGWLGQMAQTAPTLGHTIELMTRYEALVNRSYRTELLQEGDLLCLRLALPPLPVNVLRPVVEFDFMKAVSFGHFLMVDPKHELPGVDSVYFRHEPAAASAVYKQMFGCPVHFGCEHNQMLLSSDALARPLPSADTELLGHMVLLAQDRMHAMVPGIVDKLERLIIPQLPYGVPELPQIAATLAVSVSTLKRRLQAVGTNYQTVCDRLRQRMAQAYVCDPERAFLDVAFMLGFSDLSAFYRAFKRWTGFTPQQYRQKNERSL